MIETVLFDLDGMLIDSIELIRRLYEHRLCVHYGRASTPDDRFSGLGRSLLGIMCS